MSTASISTPRTRWLRWGALGAVVLVPLAFAGLFVGAISGSDNALENIPAAIVNDDELVYQTAADGTETPVFAGRLLVTELTSGEGDAGFDWRITNSEDAEKALANGEVYAILTVPSNFSKSILSTQGDNPEKADISIRTDDAHSYLTGSVAQAAGSSMVATFGNALTAQYIEGIYGGLGDLGDGFAESAEGARTLADGTEDLATGAGELASGLDEYAAGVSKYSSGVGQYTAGVDAVAGGLPQISAPLTSIAKGAQGLPQLKSGINEYTNGVTETHAGLEQINAAIQQYPTVDPALKAGLQQAVDGLGSLSDAGAGLRAGVKDLPRLSSGLNQLATGLAEATAGAAKLSAGSADLRSGGNALATGASDIAGGATSLADGASTLADGTGKLADGLAEGADKVPSFSDDQIAKTAEVASDPVSLTVTTDNAVTDVGQGIATLLVPLGLWLGAFAVFLVLQPVSRRALTSTAASGRLVLATLARASIVTAAQALALVALLHLALKVDWVLLPATLGFSLLIALAFTAVHYLLTVAFGRAGLVVSLLLLAIQVTSTGSLYPIEVLAAPFQAVSSFLPLTHAVSGMQVIISGGDVASIGTAIAGLVVFGVVATLLSFVAIGRTRRAAALGLVPSAV